MLSLTYISSQLISIRFGDISIYFYGHLPIAFRHQKEVILREASSAISTFEIDNIKLIEEFSGRKIVEKDADGFNYALKKAYKSALYAETSRITIKRMGIKDDNEECDPGKSRNITIRTFHERFASD